MGARQLTGRGGARRLTGATRLTGARRLIRVTVQECDSAV